MVSHNETICALFQGTEGIQLLNGSVKDGIIECTVAYDPSEKTLFGFKRDQVFYLLLAAGTTVER